MAAHILDTLEKAEEDWRAQSPQWKAKVGKWKAWQVRQKNKERVTQKAAAQRRDRDDDGAGSIPQQSEGHSWESYFDPKDPSPQFSFAGASSYSKEELLADIASLSWTSTPDFLFRALWRGIAVHHKRYEQVLSCSRGAVRPNNLIRLPEIEYWLCTLISDFFALASFKPSSQQVNYPPSGIH